MPIDDPGALIHVLRPRLDGALLALDFDGTLAPIVPDPNDSRPVPGAIEALRTLATAGTRVAVITGRDAETVVRLGGLDAVPDIRVAGLYGAETWQDGTLDTLPTPDEIEALRTELTGALHGADPDVWVEDKRLSLVVHTRLTADPAANRDALAPSLTALGHRLGFLVELGNGVVEFRLHGYDKAGALRRLAEPLLRDGDGRWSGALLYAGDDLGDLPAFAEARRLRELGVDAASVAVLASGVPEVAAAADVTVPDCAAMVRLLQGLTG